MKDLKYYVELNKAEETLKQDRALEEAREYVQEYKTQILKEIALAVGKPYLVVRIPSKRLIHCQSTTVVSQYLIDAILELPELAGYDVELDDARNEYSRKLGVTITESKEAERGSESGNLPPNDDDGAKYVISAIVIGLVMLAGAYLLNCAGYIR